MKIGFILKGLVAYNAHIKPFIENADKDNHEFYIFHLNNFYSKDYSITDDRVKLINLSNYKNYVQLIKSLDLNFMVSINPGNIFDLFILSISRILGVKTIYFQHGIQLDFSSFDPKLLNQRKDISSYPNKVSKYFFFYYKFLLNTFYSNNRFFLIKTVLQKTFHLFQVNKRSKLPKYGLESNHTDYAFVYGNKDRQYLIESMKMDKNKIFLSGYPFCEPSNNHSYKNKPKTALYISTGLRAVGVIPITIEDEKKHYKNVFRQLSSLGFNLIIKLHPSEDIELFKTYIKSDKVKFIKDGNLSDLTIE